MADLAGARGGWETMAGVGTGFGAGRTGSGIGGGSISTFCASRAFLQGRLE